MRKSSIILLITLLLFAAQTPNVFTETQLLFRTARSTSSPHYISNYTMRAINGTLWVEMVLLQRLARSLKTHMEIQIRLANAKHYQTLLSYDIDVCTVVIALKDNLIKKWFRSVLKYGNFMETCPVYPGHYFLRDWQFDSELVPKYLRPGDYRVKGRVYHVKNRGKNEEFIANFDVDVKLV